MSKFEVPVLVIGFNRPDFLKALLDRLKEDGISTLFVSLDGPRNELEKEICKQSLEVVLSYSSYFDLKILSRKENLGCALGVVSALDWFFSEIDFGVVLEDDCIPSDSFFDYVLQARSEFLGRHGEGKMVISGHNPFLNRPKDELSKYVLIHGWATWSSIWELVRKDYFDLQLPISSNSVGQKRRFREAIYWWANSSRARLGGVDTWDSIFVEQLWKMGVKTLIPKTNLVFNVGFGSHGTHTRNFDQSNLVKDGTEYEDLDFDEALSRHYFKISRRHLATPFAKVLLDFLNIRKSRAFEKILSADFETRELITSSKGL